MAWPKGVKRGSRNSAIPGVGAPHQDESGTSADVSRETLQEQEGDGVGLTSMPMPRGLAQKTARAIADGKLNPAKKTWQMRAGNNWETATISDDSPRYALDIPAELVPAGLTFQWATRSIYGQPMQQSLNASHAAGWTDVHESDFDGLGKQIANMFETDSGGFVVKEACILQARPTELHKKAVARDERRAKDQVALKAAAFTGGQINATGADHPTALGSNRINRSFERVEIPKE